MFVRNAVDPWLGLLRVNVPVLGLLVLVLVPSVLAIEHQLVWARMLFVAQLGATLVPLLSLAIFGLLLFYLNVLKPLYRARRTFIGPLEE